MVVKRKEIDIDDLPGWNKLTDDLDQHPDGVVLRRGGRRIARLLLEEEWDSKAGLPPELEARMARIPIHGTDGQRYIPQPMTPERAERLIAAATALGELLDLDQMRRNLEESRQLSIRLQREKDRERFGGNA